MNRRQKMKRIISALILISMLAALAACGGENTDEKETTVGSSENSDSVSDTVETKPLDALERKDLGGKTFKILDANDYQETYQNLPGDELNGDIVNDGLIDRATYVSENLGVKFEYAVERTSDGYAAVRQSVMADEHNVDLLIGGISSGMHTLATSGIFANLLDIEGLSLDEKWWSGFMNENVQYNGKLYITSGDLIPTMYCALHCTFLNNKLLDTYGIDTDYYSLVRDGKWTIDELIAIGKDRDNDLDNDGVLSAKDFLGVACMNDMTAALAAGCGVKFSTIKDGKIVVDLSNEKTVDVVEKLEPLMRQIKYDDRSEIMYNFKEDRSIAMVHLSASGKNWFRDMNSDFMILPLPKWDEAQENYYSYLNTWTTAYASIPVTADMEIVGDVTEMLARYSYQNIRPKYYNLVLKQKAARDEASGEMLDIIFDSAYVDFNMIYNFGGTFNVIKKAYQDNLPIVSSLASAQSATEAEIEEFEKNW